MIQKTERSDKIYALKIKVEITDALTFFSRRLLEHFSYKVYMCICVYVFFSASLFSTQPFLNLYYLGKIWFF